MRKVILFTVLLGVFILVSRAGYAVDCGCDTATQSFTVNGNLMVATNTTQTGNKLTVEGSAATRDFGATSDVGYAILDANRKWKLGININNTVGAGKFSIYDLTSIEHRFIIDTSGNVGIGLTPSYKLQISGTDDVYGDAKAIFGIKSNLGSELSVGIYETGNYAWIRSYEAGISFRDLSLQPDGGKVGIRTTSPSSELEVNGAIEIEAGTTDHKFSSDGSNNLVIDAGTGGNVIIKLGGQ